MANVVLGDIELDSVIGRGGMAVVWRGYSRRERLPVAVKLLTQTDDPIQLHRFQDEIRSVARLRHANIVDVVEMGTVPDELADRGPGLQPGAPWLAMEYVDGGTLREFAPRMTWKEIRAVLRQLLSALGHAHARDIIHRDLKPTNVLIRRGADGRLQAQISDFGIAYTRGLRERDSAFEDRVSGTPRYMAPEQIEGRWRDHGPWTDLYALGCIAHWLVSGRAPFGADDLAELLRGHLYGTVGALEPEVPLPDGFDRWVGNLLRKDPSKRYRFAADAAFGLARLTSTDYDGPMWHRAEYVEDDDDVTEAFTQRDWASVEHQRFARSTLQVLPGVVERPDVPRSWRPADHGQEARHPGLSLFALRTPPLVGRERLLDEMWGALHRVDEDRQPRCLVLRGRAGTGKSHAAKWLGARASEVGAATYLSAFHSSAGGPETGLGAMFARHLECFGLPLEGVEKRLADWWATHGRMDHQAIHDVRVLARYMPFDVATFKQSGSHVPLESPAGAFERALRIIAHDRPIYILLDDVQWDVDSIALARHLLAAKDLPLLIVCTAQREALEGEPDASAELSELLAAGARRIDVGPLDDATQAQLVGSLLALDDGSVEEIVRRTGGNPLFAVQLLDECVERRLLIQREDHFVLEAGAAVGLSDDVREVWLQRVKNLLEGLDEGARRTAWESLEIAAALGNQIDDARWRHACNLADLQIDQRLFDRYLDSRLVERSEGRWSFVHSSLRDVLEQHARSEGRWRRHCLVCAESVRWFGQRSFGELHRRRALYFLQADEPSTALRPLLEAARAKLLAGRADEAARLRERHHRLCERLELGKTDVARVGYALANAEAHLVGEDIDAAVAWARVGLDGARESEDANLLLDALRIRGDVMRHRDIEEAIRAHDEALELANGLYDADAKVTAVISAAYTRCFHPAVRRAIELSRGAVSDSESGPPETQTRARLVLATALRQSGDLDGAAIEVAAARRTASGAGSRRLEAWAELESARIERLRRNWPQAERWANRARNTLRGYGDRLRAQAELEHALAAAQRFAPARVLAELRKSLQRASLPASDVRSAEAYMRIAALEEDGKRAMEAVRRGQAAVEVGAFDRCLAVAIDDAADHAAERGDLPLAEQLWSLGRMQWRMLGTQTVSPNDRGAS